MAAVSLDGSRGVIAACADEIGESVVSQALAATKLIERHNEQTSQNGYFVKNNIANSASDLFRPISLIGYMKSEIIKSRVTELRKARGLRRSQLAEAAGMQLPTLAKYEDLPRRPSPRFAPPLAKALGVPEYELFAPIGAPIPDAPANSGASTPKRVARFAAARRAHWDDRAEAASALGVTVKELHQLEIGEKPLTADFLWKFICITRYPASWIEEGTVEDMSGYQAARIAGIAPDLIEE